MTRKSERELERDVEDLAAESPDVAGWITLLTADDVEGVPARPGFVRVDGEVKRLLPKVRDGLGLTQAPDDDAGADR